MTLREDVAYRFADFALQPGERRLLQGSNPIPMTPKAFEILQFLVEHAGRLVSKDDLMAAIWPGRFVTESNLTKHVWTLRQALGEGEEGGRFIETVPKVGYRFVATVTQIRADLVLPPHAEPADGIQPTLVAAQPHRVTREPWRSGTLIVSVLLAAASLVAWWLWKGSQPVFPWSTRAPGTAVAVFDFDNLSHSARNAWIGSAYSEMLGTEIAQGGQLHLLPGELVRSTRGGTPEPDAGGFAPLTLEKLRHQLAVDYIVTGSYLVLDKPADPPAVRLDVALQDARSGATIAEFSQMGALADLPVLVARAGADLRKDLNVKTSGSDLRLTANVQPPNADVMQRIGSALDALHHFDPARARDELLQAVAEAPDYALSYVYLAKAWSALGYSGKALAAAKQAAAHSADLPEPTRLKIEAQSYEAQFQWANAIATLQRLAMVQPDDPEVPLELVNVLLSAGRPKDADDMLERLRNRGEPMASDPRIELASARIAFAQDDLRAYVDHAKHALAMAEARDATGLRADAERELGVALGSTDSKAAVATLQHSLADYHRIGNPSGEAAVHRDLGNALSDIQPKLAHAEYEKCLSQYQAIGDLNGMASAYADLATVILWPGGDRDGAETATRTALRLRQETGDIAGQAWALTALAVMQSDERTSEEAIAGFRQAAALDARIGEHGHLGFTLVSLSDVLRLRGDFTQAQSICVEAQAEFAKVREAVSQTGADFECAQISLDRGDVPTVEASLQHLRNVASKRHDVFMLANIDTEEGLIAMGKDDWSAAEKSFASAGKETAQGGFVTGEAVASALYALCESALGKTAARDSATKHAADVRSRINERQEIIQVDIALAELSGETESPDEALAKLDALASDARSRQWPGWALEAELAQLQVLRKSGQTSRAQVLRARIAAEAREQGFGWVLKRAIGS